MKGIEQAIRNLNTLSKSMVPRATAQSLNRVAGRAVAAVPSWWLRM